MIGRVVCDPSEGQDPEQVDGRIRGAQLSAHLPLVQSRSATVTSDTKRVANVPLAGSA